jgi:predicted phosphodiesterase
MLASAHHNWLGRLRLSALTIFAMSPFLRIQNLAPVSGRTWCIGDIHGCPNELEALLNRLKPATNDRIIALGDLINRGPDSARVLQLAREAHVLPLLGNHERRLLQKYHRPGSLPKRKSDSETLRQLSPRDWNWIADWPHVYRIDPIAHLLVHGGFQPDIPWAEQSPDIVTRIQVLDPEGNPAKRSEYPEGPPWSSNWTGPETVIYGHTPRPAPLVHNKAVGIDTGCVYGYHLTAYCLESKKFRQVQAACAYTPS